MSMIKMFTLYLFVLVIFVVLIFCLDIIHVLRTIFVLLPMRKRKGGPLNSITDVGILKRMCLPFDLDLFMHMNNGNYLKHCDIARIQFWKETRVWNLLFKLGGSMTLGGSCNRYRRAITLFTKFTINTRVIYWDDTAFYVEQTFVRDKDEFICFIALIKQTVIGIKPEQIIENLGYEIEKPEILPELKLWIESTSLSSERLRKKS